jgi:uncharacterized phage protein (TIGR01671 family)
VTTQCARYSYSFKGGFKRKKGKRENGMNEMKKESRRILFRAWDKLNKAMYTNPFIGKHDGMNNIFADAGDWIYLQYTGEKDKEGNEVYEADVLEANTIIGNGFSRAPSHFTDRYIVTFENGKFTFGGYTFDNGFIENMKVIGNTYENPELIKQPKEK